MTHYEALEVERYMRSETDRLAARDPSEFIPGLRETVDRVFMGFENKPPAMLKTLDLAPDTYIAPVVVNGLECEWVYHSNADHNRRMLYLHGGGMVAGSAETHRAMVSRIALRTGMAILVPNYRLAPEAPYPAALDDAVSLTNWLWDNAPTCPQTAKQLFLVGDSAGGGLVLSTLVNCQNQLKSMPTAAATFSALSDFTASGESIDSNLQTDVLLTREAIQGLGTIYGGTTPLNDPNVSPLHGDIKGLPPLHMQVSDTEVLLDDSLRFFEKHKTNGGQGELKVYPGMVHVWQAFSPYLPEAEQALTDLANFFTEF
ncbi:alpha/beta hydrolase [Maricurvus nonylphenolicus]|uniref:alpha/beta hydrolase n=1 Tax=Maricurvus nonylphenolicus TaxID=1008307 RepID=UPI0036F291AB